MDHAAQVRAFIIANFLFDDHDAMIADQASFIEAGIIDSTGVMEILLFLEETFGIRVEDEELVPENFDSIEGLVGLIERKRKRAAQA